MIQADGNLTLNLCVSDITSEKWENGDIVTITSTDPVYPIQVSNVFKTYFSEDIIETWTEIGSPAKFRVCHSVRNPLLV